jgi:hypothetical protein
LYDVQHTHPAQRIVIQLVNADLRRLYAPIVAVPVALAVPPLILEAPGVQDFRDGVAYATPGEGAQVALAVAAQITNRSILRYIRRGLRTSISEK